MARLIGEQPFHGLRCEGRRFDCGDKAGYLEAQIAFALERADLAPAMRGTSRPMAEAALPGGMPPADRDLAGYGRNPPDPGWPGGARLASPSSSMSRKAPSCRSPAATSATRAVQRRARRWRARPTPAWRPTSPTARASGCGAILDAARRPRREGDLLLPAAARWPRRPALAAEPAARGHEVSAHGWRWEKHADMAEATERAVIARDGRGARPTPPARGRSAGTPSRRPRSTRGGCCWRMAASSTTATPMTTTCRAWCRSPAAAARRPALRLRHQRHALPPRRRLRASPRISRATASPPSTGCCARAARRR